MNNTPDNIQPTEILAPSTPATALAIPIHDEGPLAFYLDTGKFQQMWRVAQLFSRTQLVPSHFQGQPENCFVAAELANRLGLNPLMVMQNTYIVYGKPGMEAKLVIAIINKSGLYKGPLHFRMTGEKSKDSWGCIAWAIDRETGEKIEGPEITLALARAEGWLGKKDSKWQTMPELMLRYRAAMFFARFNCPELTMGMQTAEELEDVGPAPTPAAKPVVSVTVEQPDAHRPQPRTAAVLEKIKGPQPQPAEAA